MDALKDAPGRRAIILMTDGRATGNRLDVEQAGARAAAAGVLVNVVGEDSEMLLRQEGNTGVRVRPGVALDFLANKTGGLYLPDSASPAAPGPVLEKVLADLHERYTMTFALPVRDGGPPTFQVQASSAQGSKCASGARTCPCPDLRHAALRRTSRSV